MMMRWHRDVGRCDGQTGIMADLDQEAINAQKNKWLLAWVDSHICWSFSRWTAPVCGLVQVGEVKIEQRLSLPRGGFASRQSAKSSLTTLLALQHPSPSYIHHSSQARWLCNKEYTLIDHRNFI
jgi:hypothetical protein